MYRKSALGAIEEVLHSGERRLRRVFDRCDTRYVDLEPGREPVNLNTVDAYEQFVASATAADGAADPERYRP